MRKEDENPDIDWRRDLVPLVHRRLILGDGGRNPAVILEPATPIALPIDTDTIDMNPDRKPTILHDLNDFPWPVPDAEYDDVHAYEVLEHLGVQGSARSFFDTFNEVWRVLVPGGKLYASTPAWDSLWAWGDPSHTRIINEGSLAFLSTRNPVGTMSDFRHLIRGWFDVDGHTTEKGRFLFVLKKGEVNEDC